MTTLWCGEKAEATGKFLTAPELASAELNHF
jgi:hypothetical protein